jgi:hypothetical protein
MGDASSAIIGFLVSVGVMVILPFYLIHKETQKREGKDKGEDE